MKRRTPTRVRTAVVAVAALIVGLAAPIALAPAADADGVTIANIARGELGPNGSPGHGESPANSGCNKYTGALYGHSSGCAPEYGNKGAWGTWAWCADFATWVWKQAGVDIGGLTSAVSSFTAYGNSHGTYHAVGSGYTPQPGDAAIYGTAHVGIVVSSGKYPPDVVSGNMLVNGNWQVYLAYNSTNNGGGAALTGFVTPVGGSSGGGPQTGHVLGNSCVYLHTAPDTGTPQITCIPNGTNLAVECVKAGQSVNGPYGTENTWDRTTYGGQLGFISDAWLYTGTNAPVAPDCGGNGVILSTGCQALYAAPTTNSAALSCVPQAIALSVDCVTTGDAVTGPFGTENIWDHTSYGGTGFVPDADIYTGTNNAIAGTCASIPRPPTAQGGTLPRASLNHAYSTTLTASGGTGGYTWSLQRGSLPKGMSLNSSGVLSGTPRRGGKYTVGVQVADAIGLVGTTNEILNVAVPTHQVTLTHRQSARTITRGQRVTIGTTATDAALGKVLAGATVCLQRQSGRSWVTLDKTRTRSTGKTSYRYKPSRTSTLRWHTPSRTTRTVHYPATNSHTFKITVS